MKITKILLPIIFVSFFVAYFFSFNGISQKDIHGIYISNSSSYIDTLVLYPSGTYYHALRDMRYDTYQTQFGIWKPTIDGYYEFTGYGFSGKSILNGWDAKFIRNKFTKKITLPLSIDGTVKYIRCGNVD